MTDRSKLCIHPRLSYLSDASTGWISSMRSGTMDATMPSTSSLSPCRRNAPDRQVRWFLRKYLGGDTEYWWWWEIYSWYQSPTEAHDFWEYWWWGNKLWNILSRKCCKMSPRDPKAILLLGIPGLAAAPNRASKWAATKGIKMSASWDETESTDVNRCQPGILGSSLELLKNNIPPIPCVSAPSLLKSRTQNTTKFTKSVHRLSEWISNLRRPVDWLGIVQWSAVAQTARNSSKSSMVCADKSRSGLIPCLKLRRRTKFLQSLWNSAVCGEPVHSHVTNGWLPGESKKEPSQWLQRKEFGETLTVKSVWVTSTSGKFGLRFKPPMPI